ncbi:MAG: glycoside hydrolase family 2 protein [Lachnospiraceae bacterium]|nr:glycoside hydrolase family 2 protein [Lachnospiraceae bacterium]
MNTGRIYIDRGWKFSETFSEEKTLPDYDEGQMTDALIPHTVKETPFHYFDEGIYQMVSLYRRHLFAEEEWKEKMVLLTFEGVAHEATVYVNGRKSYTHHCGYTAFTVDISVDLEYGHDNVIAVRVDSNETLDQPPFGFAIDYMTYGGIYRDVYIEVKPRAYISRTVISTKLIERFEKDGKRFCRKGAVIAKVYNEGCSGREVLTAYIRRKGSEEKLGSDRTEVTEGYTEIAVRIDDVELWDVENPALYELVTVLADSSKGTADERIDTFGFRKAVFRANGFFLNGRKLKIRGLNRHQSYAYVGYAMPDSMQKLDADILKNELGVNAVRTSHYPQAQSFIDRCDEIGLLVFTEIPGWQHIGGEEWKDKAVDNVKDMIRQNINHPSIILWGVRINESVDDEEFYARTNALAHAEDPDRQTGGVRCYRKGIFQEDVYTFNDFSHYGENAGTAKKNSVTSDSGKPYLITEYNGHMFPTKAFDSEDHRLEHMLRHARVLDSAARDPEITGSFGWCMFDYNTHKDFGSGDRICYHGVCDMFRNPKLAAYVYAAQQDRTPVLEISSAMNIGEHPGGNTGEVYIISNADSVRMYKNDELIKEYDVKNSSFSGLIHGPVKIDDYVGDALTVHEGMPPGKAREIKSLLNSVAEHGMYRLSPAFMAKAAVIAARYRMRISDAVELYNKYVANWGGKVSIYRFEAVKNGEVVKETVISPSSQMHIEAMASSEVLFEKKTYDVALVRLLAVDENGNILNFCNDPVEFATEGAIEIIGPHILSLSGGAGGTYVRSNGTGKGILSITDGRGQTVKLEFKVSGEGGTR